MRVTVLGSGSGGNATLVEAEGTRLLVDAGLPDPEVRARLCAAIGEVPRLDAVVLTHAHADHSQHAKSIALSHGVPIWLSESTQRGVRLAGPVRSRVFGARAPFRIGAIDVLPMPVPHDAPQVALVFRAGGRSSSIITDLGEVPPGLSAHLAECDTVLIESNHDLEMLQTGPYPGFLKRRVGSRRGHLSNDQCAELLRALGPTTTQVVLMHLSQRNNTPELARRVAEKALAGRRVRLSLAHQDVPLVVEVRGARPHQLALAI